MHSEEKENFVAKNMREVVKRRMIVDTIRASASTCVGWLILVLDDEATRILSSVAGMYEVMEERITLVESISKKRQAFPQMEVVYILEPTESSVTLLLQDFSNPSKLMYGDVHLYFLHDVSIHLIGMIRSCTELFRRIKTFKEINVDFLAVESNAFHFDMFDYLPTIRQNSPSVSLSTSSQRMVQKLFSVCATLSEYPIIRYKSSNQEMAQIANALNEMLRNFSTNAPNWLYNGRPGLSTDKPSATLLLFDRSDDVVSPLLHEFTYQALARDLIPIRGDQYEYVADTQGGVKKTKTILLNESDNLWTECRHSHIAKVLEILRTRMINITASNPNATLMKDSKDKNLSVSDIAAVVKQLPEYRELTEKLNDHYSIASNCLSIVTQQNLVPISEVEQIITTTVDENGNNLKYPQILERLNSTLQSNISNDLKIRLCSIFVLSQKGISIQDLNNMLNFATLPSNDTNFIRLLNTFASNLPKETKQSNNIISPTGLFNFAVSQAKKATTTTAASTTAQSEYSSSRYVCPLKQIVELITQEKLPTDEYAAVQRFVNVDSSVVAKSVRKTQNKNWTKDKQTFDGPRTIVFVVGGCCYSEIRSCYEVMTQQEKEVIIGSTSFITPTDFLNGLRQITQR